MANYNENTPTKMTTTELQLELLKICIEKKLVFQMHPKHDLVQVIEFGKDNEVLFHESEFVNFNGESKLLSLIERVKNYKK